MALNINLVTASILLNRSALKAKSQIKMSRRK